MSNSKILLCKRLALSTLLAALSALPALANDVDRVRALLDSGRLGEAQAMADAFLAQHPLDAQMQFLKGMILAGQERTAEAIAVFEKLNGDHPDLPEPYNNLAVLYASVGQLDKARVALETAVRHKPSYAIAHENLGDVYARLAGQSYDKVTQLDPGRAKAKLKRSMILAFAATADSSKSVPPPMTPAPMTSSASTNPSSNPNPSPSPSPSPVAKRDGEHDAVLAAVNSWATAWSTKDLAAYLNLYSPDFQTPEGESRGQWEEKRRSRIEGKGKIDVKIESLTVTVRGTWAKVKFRQIYTSDRLSSKDLKALILEKRGDKWLIKKEYLSI
ncbi:MAG TPA: tetratricopeptide repeat protein [Noviherbaspirillum sp.]|nr:tetratricopeptide repeat protein [Noviherbaspirillum sp.]